MSDFWLTWLVGFCLFCGDGIVMFYAGCWFERWKQRRDAEEKAARGREYLRRMRSLDEPIPLVRADGGGPIRGPHSRKG